MITLIVSHHAALAGGAVCLREGRSWRNTRRAKAFSRSISSALKQAPIVLSDSGAYFLRSSRPDRGGMSIAPPAGSPRFVIQSPEGG